MPLIDSPPDALAEVYARSLFEMADEQGKRATVESCLGELEDILESARENPRFGEFLASRVLPTKERSESIEKIFKGRISDLTLRFLQVVNEKGRLSHLPAIVAAYDRTVQEKFGRVEVDVYTASPISTEELRMIRERLQAALGKEPIVHPYTDGSMLGGIRMQIGDRLIDGSLSTRLRRLRDKLATDGTAELRTRIERIIDDAGSNS
jgi:F-type H+-transporting ATPase subunit delta